MTLKAVVHLNPPLPPISRIDLLLAPAEAATLLYILEHVGGNRQKSPRRYIGNILERIQEALRTASPPLTPANLMSYTELPRTRPGQGEIHFEEYSS